MLCRGTEFENVVMLCGGYKWQGPIDIFFFKMEAWGFYKSIQWFSPSFATKKMQLMGPY